MAEQESPLTLSKDDTTRMREVERLAQEGARHVDALINQLDDPSWAVRRAVSGALARVGQAVVEPLCNVLRTRRDAEARIAAAVDTLASARADVDPSVLAMIETERAPGVLCDAAQILGRRRSQRAVPALERLARHPDDNVAVSAIEALARVGNGAGLTTLIEVIHTGNFFRTFPAIEVLGASGDSRAVASLIELLGKPLFAIEAVRALGHGGDNRCIGPLMEYLRSADDAFVRAAAMALAEIHRRQMERVGSAELLERRLAGSQHAQEESQRLARCISASDPIERVAVAQVLGWIAHPAGIAPLFELLWEVGPVSNAASASLKVYGSQIDEMLFKALREADSARRLVLLPLVAGRRGSAKDLAACLTDPDVAVRVAACDALGRLGDPAAVDALFALLDDDARVSQAAIAAIHCLGSARTEHLALQAARADAHRVRRAALRIIAYFGYASGFDALVAAMDDEDERLRDAGIHGLAFLEDPRAIGALLRAAMHPDAKSRAAAVRALGQTTNDPRVLAALRVALKDGDAWVRYYACQSLGKLRDPDAAASVMQLLDDPAGQVRIAVVDALAHLRSERAIDALQVAARSNDADVRRAALVGLGVTHSVDAVPLLIEAAASTESATRLVALAALHEFDLPDVVPALTRGALDADESVRDAAIGFLAARAGLAATQALVEIVRHPMGRARAMEALSQPAQGRLAGILSMLEGANESLAGVLVGALVRANRADWNAALLTTMRMDNVCARRAAATALGNKMTPESIAELGRASNEDLDPEVRRICAVALGA